jgi:hypothetical protein
MTAPGSRSPTAARDLGRDGRSARDDQLQAGQVAGVDRRMAGEPRHHRRRPDDDRGAMAVDELDEGVDGEARQRHRRRTGRQRVGQGDDEAHDVREGRDRDDGVARSELQRRAHLPHGGHEVGVGEHDATPRAAFASASSRREMWGRSRASRPG